MPNPPTEDLWPEDIKADIRTPSMILKAQAQALRKRTKGLLVAEVEARRQLDPGLHALRFDVVAPPFHYARNALFQVTHNPEQPYPAAFISSSQGPANNIRAGLPTGMAPNWLIPAGTPQNLTAIVAT